MQGKKIIKIVKSPMPYYISSASALIMALIVRFTEFDGLAISTYLIILGTALGIFYIAKLIFKPRQEIVYEKFTTHDEIADQFIEEGNQCLEILKSLDLKIENEKVSHEITRVITALEALIKVIIKKPEKAKILRKFFAYYLPALTKILTSYDELEEVGKNISNLRASMRKIEEIMVTVANAFEKQLDLMYTDEAVEMTVEGQVLETLLSQQGLTREK